MTGQELLYRSMRLAGIVTHAGRTPSTYEFDDARKMFNSMVDDWNAQRLAVYQTVRREFTLNTNTASVTLGPDADWIAPRPAKIEGAGIVVNGIETPLSRLDDAEYAEWCTKTETAQAPAAYYDDGSFPLRRLYFLPVPTQASAIALYVWQQMSAMAAITDTANLPPAYDAAVMWNLALQLSAQPRNGQPAPPPDGRIVEQARISLGNLKRINLPRPKITQQLALTSMGQFDINSGGYR